MDNEEFKADVRDGYTFFAPAELDPTALDGLPAFVENLLMQKKQDLVLSLAHIDTVFSMHLTAFVQLYRLLKGFNQRFIIVDISPAVLNVMQMTQLESLLPLFLTLQDYLDSVQKKAPDDSTAAELGFEYKCSVDGERIRVECKGYMAFGEKIRHLQSEVGRYSRILFDLSGVGYVDTRVLILIGDLASHHTVEIVGASNVIRELFQQHRLQGRVSYLD